MILEYTITTPNQQFLPHKRCNSNPTNSHPNTRLYTQPLTEGNGCTTFVILLNL